jgi:hypothetical protein
MSPFREFIYTLGVEERHCREFIHTLRVVGKQRLLVWEQLMLSIAVKSDVM